MSLSACFFIGHRDALAHVTISPKGDATLDLSSAAAHLCSECLAELASTLHGNVCGIGIVNFSSHRLYALQESTIGFGAGDYYVHCDFDTKGGKISVIITFIPLRYDDGAN